MKILVLANSRKQGGSCVAGLSWPDLDRWVRPVNPSAIDGQFRGNWIDSEGAIQFGPKVKDGAGRLIGVEPLDIVEFDGANAPLAYQPENIEVSDKGFLLADRVADPLTLSRLLRASKTERDLFGLSYQPPNCVLSEQADEGLARSLELLEVTSLTGFANDYGKSRIRFTYQKKGFDFPLTDPTSEHKLAGGKFSYPRALVTLSIGEAFQPRNRQPAHYVVAACVLPIDSGLKPAPPGWTRLSPLVERLMRLRLELGLTTFSSEQELAAFQDGPLPEELAAFSDDHLRRAGKYRDAGTMEGWLAASNYLLHENPYTRVLQIWAANGGVYPQSVTALDHLAQDPTIASLNRYSDDILHEAATAPGVHNYRTWLEACQSLAR